MRPRTPSIVWIPFVFSIGFVSWAMLLTSLALLSVLVLGPAVRDVKAAEAQRNDVQATLDLLNQKITLQTQFVQAASTDPLLMERLASRQLHLDRPDQQVLMVDPRVKHSDRSIAGLLAASLEPVTPQPVTPLPWWINATLTPALRPMLLMIALTGLVLSFLLGVKFERR